MLKFLVSNQEAAGVTAGLLAEDVFKRWASQCGPGTVLQPEDALQLRDAVYQESKRRLGELFRERHDMDPDGALEGLASAGELDRAGVEELFMEWVLTWPDGRDRVEPEDGFTKEDLVDFLTWAFSTVKGGTTDAE